MKESTTRTTKIFNTNLIKSVVNFLIENACNLYSVIRRLYSVDILEESSYLHSIKVVHGDLKCDNILIQGGTEIAKICDFGVSDTLSGDETLPDDFAGRFKGTPRFMVPEVRKKGFLRKSTGCFFHWVIG